MSGSHLIGQNLAHIETESAHMLTIHAQIGNIMSAKNAQQIFRKLIFLAPPLGWLLFFSLFRKLILPQSSMAATRPSR